ncbi:hypothetical protein D3C72_2576770 [compost metagenome]
MKISADRNSFQLAMKANSATVTMPGITSGRKMRTRIWNDIAPSTLAASSSSRGMASKLLRIR